MTRKSVPIRLLAYYLVLATVTFAAAAILLTVGSDKRAQPAIAGSYELVAGSRCLGSTFVLEQSGQYVDLESASGATIGRLTFDDGQLRGTVQCASALGARPIDATLEGGHLRSGGVLPLVAVEKQPASADGTTASPSASSSAGKPRPFDDTVAAFLVAVVVVVLLARLVGSVMPKLGQPRVVGEVLAGIMLGPTLLGRLDPSLETSLFPSDIVPYLGVAAYLGLAFYMFLVGLELDFRSLRGRLGQALAISNTSVAIPMVAGLAVAVPLYGLLGPPKPFAAFALFMGVAMSITAFPVLARIVVERRLTSRPVGLLALASAAGDDITAWFLVALASAVAAAGSELEALTTIALTAAFCLVMFAIVRPLLRRASVAFDEAGQLPGAWMTVIFAGVLLAAYATDRIGVALIFGAFVMGLVMPRHSGLTDAVTSRIETFVVTLLLPLFFAYTGLQTNFLLLGRGSLVLITAGLVAVAIICKFSGAVLAARVTRLGWRDSAMIGTLMNTRGLTELIVLNLALAKGVITPALFAALVIMALVTTLMSGPLLAVLDKRKPFAEVEHELDRARCASDEEVGIAIPERSILVAPHSAGALAQLSAIARLIGSTEPAHEVIFARLVSASRAVAIRGGVHAQLQLVRDAAEQLEHARGQLLNDGIAARAVAFTSSDPGADLVRLADREQVDLILTDGRRPLLGPGIPCGDVGAVLRDASPDVAVLVNRSEQPLPVAGLTPIVVPFGGAEHDWAALELGAWIASASGGSLRLLGAVSKDGRDPDHLLTNASLVVQQFVGIEVEAVVTPRSRNALALATADAGLFVIGLSARWRLEGLGRTRADLARATDTPILFVRRGSRPGLLGTPDTETMFSWSSLNLGPDFVADPA